MHLNKLGIVQGRLLPPIGNHIQEFPRAEWKLEFDLMENLGLTHIEWIVTDTSFKTKTLNLDVKKYGSKISSVCCDHLIDNHFYKKSFLKERLEPACEFAIKNNIKSLTIPLLEKSKLNNFNIDSAVENFVYFGKKYPSLNFSFEIENNADISLCLADCLPNFYLTYDTGNITSCGIDHEIYIEKVFHKINNVHLKDRTVDPISTVEPGNGDTDFYLIFDILSKKCYKGWYTLQTARSKNGSETETISRHIKFYEKFIRS
jgi:sugar phosphate isomerase/epimerase